MPSVRGDTSIIEQAIAIGRADPSLLVYGAVSDARAMPNYSEKKNTPDDGGENSIDKTPSPATFDEGNVHVVRASALYKGDVVGDFEAELLSAGFAIIHDKILIIDPLSDDCVVVTGSHNLGYKASYANDDNLLIIQGNRALAQAYTVHVLDLYDHYRFRAVQQERHAQVGARKFEGFLCRDDSWLDAYRDPAKGALARYFSAA